jgi:hypothetical protein
MAGCWSLAVRECIAELAFITAPSFIQLQKLEM